MERGGSEHLKELKKKKKKTGKRERKKELGRECSITIYIPTCNQQRPLVYFFFFFYSPMF
jgi:hypothetical protein